MVRALGIRDNVGSTELFAVPAGSRVVLGRDGLFPRELTLMSSDCGQTEVIYSFDTRAEGGSVKIAADRTVSREPGGVLWFGDNAAPVTCPPS